MPQRRERRWPWIAAGYAALFAIVSAITAFLHDSVASQNQPVTIRLAVAFTVAIVLIHLRRHFRGDPRWDPPSGFENALTPQPSMPKLDDGFVKLRDELANGGASRSYFEKTLWPRLRGLARAHGHEADLSLPDPTWLARGPSRRTLAALIERIEDNR